MGKFFFKSFPLTANKAGEENLVRNYSEFYIVVNFHYDIAKRKKQFCGEPRWKLQSFLKFESSSQLVDIGRRLFDGAEIWIVCFKYQLTAKKNWLKFTEVNVVKPRWKSCNFTVLSSRLFYNKKVAINGKQTIQFYLSLHCIFQKLLQDWQVSDIISNY